MSSDLIRKLRKAPGNEKLWAEWYKSAYPRVYYAAYRLSYGRTDVARDLTQETFSRFIEYRVLERVLDEPRATAYLIATCRNVAIDRNKEAGRISLEGLEAARSVAAADVPAESEIDIERVLQELGPDDGMLVQWMRDGLSVSEIALRLQVTYSAAGVKVHRLRKRLRDLISPQV
jgi:RNA polymerase sigma factor (sigma-70 family)